MPRFTFIQFRLIVALPILLGCLIPKTAWALSLQPGDGVGAPISLGGHLSVFHDPTGALTIDDVVSERADIQFNPIPSMLTEGYRRKTAVWVRFSLAAPEAQNQWLLQIERPLIEHATLYTPNQAGGFTVAVPGLRGVGDEEDAGAYPTTFLISIPSTPVEYYLRLQSSTSITTPLYIWQKEGYINFRQFDNWLIGIVIGGIFAMVVANLLYVLQLKEYIYTIYIILLISSGLITTYHLGHSSEVLSFLDAVHIQYIWGVIVCIYYMITMLFFERLFEFRHHSIWAWRASQGIVLAIGVALVFAFAGRYGDVGLFTSWLQQLSLFLIALFVSYLIFVRREYKYLLPAFAFAIVIVVLFVMQMQYTGFNPLGLDTSLGRVLAIGVLVHLGFLSAAVAQRARLAEHSLSEEKDRVIALARAAERDLTIKVLERTAELSESNASLNAEMDRRRLLEVKLRQSLASVNDALSQQRDFVALISHEFRGPLAVITAAADNLLLSADGSGGDITSRATKIRQIVKRMSMMIENILTDGRVAAEQPPFAMIEMFDLNEVLCTVEASLDDDAANRVCFVHAEEAMVKGDRTLLEIAVLNLIQNALKYSAATSPVTVRLSADQGVIFINVIDQGNGVTADNRELIFEKYYRTAGQRQNGFGLGLYISREIARQHGGDLILAASDINGSTFRLSLPICVNQHRR